MSSKRTLFLIAIVISGFALSYFALKSKVTVQLPATLSPAFQLLGKPIKTVDRSLTKLLPINDLDEKRLGDSIALRYESYGEKGGKVHSYLKSLISKLTKYNSKDFEYRILVMPTSSPNAFAMPGGVLFVTQGLLDTVHSEAELVAILGHEIGHVELSHCMDGVRGELLARKFGSATLGELADLAVGLLIRPSFSKNQEDEADQYGYELMIREGYDPLAMSLTFSRLKESIGGKETAGSPIEEYFMTHPYLSHRSEKFAEKAKKVESGYYYVGVKNLKEYSSRYDTEYDDEFVLK
ncbi:peptidase M48 [Leptospira wolffii]|uniref:Peptidase M48 n=1 Tax=Leptospira wolffii TaxID=409998 RepID=A0A2M9ZEX8_9LEPT|nr:M48 family metallopeptidase [Leptospira wolffii]PJZ66985.1 peptidase M48 [Leptospira wolffii]TGK61957.1 peptidase M48 [Leptospira wolffii]TGK68558.1 peptidase M48 [Leptospira wolffii]TGK74659.1 peptidase M48 [Leptospira wolffii]TGL31765.1 peptidase M48 [Leptospira wolffii]